MTRSLSVELSAAGSRLRAASPARTRAIVLALTLVYCVLMTIAHVEWLSPLYSDYGFTSNGIEFGTSWITFPLVLGSTFLLPVNLTRVSDFVFWMLFYFTYAPIMLTLPLVNIDDNLATSTSIAMVISFAMMTSIARIKMPLKISISLREKDVSAVIVGLYFLLSLYVVVTYGSSLAIVSFDDAASQRIAAGDAASGTLVGYATGWLSGAINPFLFSIGLVTLRRNWIILGSLGQLLIYSATGLRSVLLSILFMLGFGLIMLIKKQLNCLLVAVPNVTIYAITISMLPFIGPTDGAVWNFAALVLMRTYGIGAALTTYFAYFFSVNPQTYYSHINIIGMFVTYPYARDIPYTIGEAMTTGGSLSGGFGANANFWATDGIAALGSVGVVIIGIIVGFFFSFINSIFNKNDMRFVYIAAIPFIINFSNIPFFTTLLGNGGFLLFALLIAWQATTRPKTV